MVIWQGIECQVDNCPHHLEDTVLLLFHLLFLLKNLVSVLELLALHSRSHYALVPLSTTESRQRELSFTSRACNLSDSLRIRAWIILETSQPLFLFQIYIYIFFFLLPKKNTSSRHNDFKPQTFHGSLWVCASWFLQGSLQGDVSVPCGIERSLSDTLLVNGLIWKVQAGLCLAGMIWRLAFPYNFGVLLYSLFSTILILTWQHKSPSQQREVAIILKAKYKTCFTVFCCSRQSQARLYAVGGKMCSTP